MNSTNVTVSTFCKRIRKVEVDQHKEVILLSVPYCEPIPLVAPVVLAGCLSAAGISSRAIDFNIEFLKQFENHPHRVAFKNFLTSGGIIHPQFDRKFFKEVMLWTKQFLDKAVHQHTPDIIGLSIFTSESLDFGLLLSYLIRKHHPHITLIAGGKGLEVSGNDGKKHAEIWIDNNVVDSVVVGDAESAIVELVRSRQSGMVTAKKQTKEDLDRIPLAQWSDYNLGSYTDMSHLQDRQNKNTEPYLTVTASKGCVRQCAFCDVASFWPEFIYRDPVKVANEIIHNFRATGIRKFLFTDNLINGSVSNFRQMNEILVNQIPGEITYGGYAIFRGKDQMPEKDFELASRAGNNYWSIGVESGSEKVRYDMKKKFDNVDLDWSVKMLYRYQIQQNWLLMVGFPSETEQDFAETKNLLIRYQRLNHNNYITISITPTFMLLNNSPLLRNKELSEEFGLSHMIQARPQSDKFWTSTKYLDNDYPTRSRRWKELVKLSESLGYSFGPGASQQKWWDEIIHLDDIHAEQKIKFFPISSTQ